MRDHMQIKRLLRLGQVIQLCILCYCLGRDYLVKFVQSLSLLVCWLSIAETLYLYAVSIICGMNESYFAKRRLAPLMLYIHPSIYNLILTYFPYHCCI